MIDQATIRKKAAQICEEFYRFAAIDGYTDVRINPIAVKSVVKSWADDVERHNDYHGTELSLCKHAAFLMYWLVKLKPVFLPLNGESYADPKYSTSKYKAVNERFALALALNLLKLIPKTIIKEKFIYLFFFRDVNPKHLFLTLEMLCNSIPGYLKARGTHIQLADGMG